MTPTSFRTPSAHYLVRAQLRSTPSGATYKVERESDGQTFVLKQLAIANLKHWKQFDLFEREVAALKAIEHPFVPGWVDSHLDENAGLFISVQTYVEGTTLKEILSSRGGLTAQQVENYLRQALGILMHLHERAPQIIHRDINPSNVMLAGEQVYLIDLGAVKVGGEESTSMTAVGTFGYMAPEQILGRADVKSDLYGLGMTFVTMATGLEPPSLPQNPNTGQIDPSSVLRVPPHLAATLTAMIRPGVAERPPSARVALSSLDQPQQSAAAPYGAPAAYGQPQNLPAAYQQPASYGAPLAHVHRNLSPYRTPDALSEQDKTYLRQHNLKSFPTWLAVTFHFLTWGVFSIIHYGLQHDKLPTAMHNDPSAAKAVGFNFLPYFNLYWMIFQPVRLVDRINLQDRIRDRPDGMSRGFMIACAVMGMIPYINFLIGVPLWGVGVYQMQKSINRLAKERESEPVEHAALPPIGRR